MRLPLKIIVLDRDGVINADSVSYIKSPAEWHAIPGSLAAIAKLNRANYQVVIASNQSGIARGLFSLEDLSQIHQKMQNELAKFGGHLDGIFFCPHDPLDNCECRKPKPGLLFKIAKEFKVKTEEMLMIGDSMRDLLAAKAAGIKCILVKTGNGAKTIASAKEDSSELKDVPIFIDLAEAVENILHHK
jgi:D-glycero-D-manno-heptose 1,7-bisphosphate phosphatase